MMVNGLRTVGGEERTVVDLSVGLRARGHVVRIACAPGGAFVDEAIRGGVEVSPVPLRGKESLGAMPALRRIARDFDPDIVHLHGSYPGILGAIGMLGTKAAKLWTVQLHPTWNNPVLQRDGLRRNAYARAFALAARSVDATVFVSEALAQGFREFIGAPLENAAVVHNGIVVDSFASSSERRARERAALGIAERAAVVTLVGRLTARKGIDRFIEAIARMSNRQVVAAIAGAGDPSVFRARAEELGVAHRVRFLGAVERIADLLAATDVGVLPSLGEGLPLCVMEMLAASVPVVISDLPMHREFLVAGPACSLFPVADVDAFARAVETMIVRARDFAVRERARQAAVQNFSSDVMIAGYLKQYETLLARGLAASRTGMVELSGGAPLRSPR